MYRPFDHLAAATAWMNYAVAYSQMTLAANEVIFRRSLRMAQGTMTAPEVLGMVMEKATAFTAAAERAAVAAAAGGDATRIAHAALRPIRAKARSNARKYRS